MSKIIAPCGTDCFNCELYEENVTEEFQAGLSERTKIPKELLSCKGCTNCRKRRNNVKYMCT